MVNRTVSEQWHFLGQTLQHVIMYSICFCVNLHVNIRAYKQVRYVHLETTGYIQKQVQKAQVQFEKHNNDTEWPSVVVVWWLTRWSMAGKVWLRCSCMVRKYLFMDNSETAPIVSGPSIFLIEVNLHTGCRSLAVLSRWVEGVDRHCKDDESFALDLDSFLLTELRYRLFHTKCGEASASVGIPAFLHDLCHHTQGLRARGDRCYHRYNYYAIHIP